MPTTRAKRKLIRAKAPESEGFLASAARTVGHAAGTAAIAIGLEHPEAAPAGPKAKPRRSSARVQRKSRAEQAKSAAKNVFAKGTKEPAAPYRKIMGKPVANWTEKDLLYINGLVEKHGANEPAA
jgi:hypothetical protein